MTRALVLVLALSAGACSSCHKTAVPGATAQGSSSTAPAEREAAPVPRDRTMWANAEDGGVEDLATLAVHEGAAGLVEAAEQDPALRMTAIRAMAYAHGWAQARFLAKTAAGKDDAEAHEALASLVELGSRPRRAEDPEDIEELADACGDLVALARDAARAKDRRVPALRALRTMPCPKAELPTDLDAR